MNIYFEYENLANALKKGSSTLLNIYELKRKRKQMKPKTYILKKDIFFAKAGDEFIETGTNSMSYLHKQTWCQLSVDVIENNPVLFKLKEEERPISLLYINNSTLKIGNEKTNTYMFCSEEMLSAPKICKIQEAIQKIVNDEN
jgi:hypothetical protein